MEAITPQEGCQDHMIRRYGVGDITVIIFGKYYQPQGVQETLPITQQMTNHSFSQAAGAHRNMCDQRESVGARPDCNAYWTFRKAWN